MIPFPKVPFTVTSDLDLAGRVTPYICDDSPDVHIYEGQVPQSLKNAKKVTPFYEANSEQFLVKADNDLRFLIEGGERIVYARPASVTNREVLLFLLGSAWGALAYQRGLLPLHASAVIHNDQVYAFSGPSGAGKSTLTAALSQLGQPFFSDDVLIIDPKALSENALCYAGQKDLKLWGNALELIKAKGKSPVRDDETYDKYYSDPDKYSNATVGILRHMYLLTCRHDKISTSPYTISPIHGAMAIQRFNNTIYRPMFGAEIVGQKTMFSWLAALKQKVDLLEFDRPNSEDYFHGSVEFMSQHLNDLQKQSNLEA